jgi:hypothetical protein
MKHNMNKLVNLTPHAVSLLCEDGSSLTLDPAGYAPRRVANRRELGVLNGLRVVSTTFGAVEGLPEPQPGVVFIVSALVAEGSPEREDLASPGEAIRDQQGRVIGALGLCAGPGLTRKMTRKTAPSGWVRFVFQSSYYGSHPERGAGDEEVVYYFHPTVDLSRWEGVAFSHGSNSASESYNAFQMWLGGIEDLVFEED